MFERNNNKNEYNIIGMKENNNSLLFKNKIIFRPKLDIFLNIEEELEYTLKYEIINALNNFPNMNFYNWLFSSSLQVIICNINLIFTNEISQILISNNNLSQVFIIIYSLINRKEKKII